jgi:Domain of unknown function (DUF4252)/Secretion system C-terminal sorting domain
MKKNLLFLAILLMTSRTAFSQQVPLQDFIDKYKQEKAFSYAFLSKDLFEVVAKSSIEAKDWKKLQQVVQNIGSLRILAADSIDNAISFYREAMGHIKGSDLEELLAVQDGKEKVRIWAKEEQGVVTDLVLLVSSPEEFVLVCFAGNLELGNLSELAALLNAEEAVSLAQTSKAIALDFKAFPNPTIGDFSLEYVDTVVKSATLSIFDQNGRLLSTEVLSDNTSRQFSIRDYPAGMYWVQLKTASGQVGVTSVQLVKP